MNLAEALDQFRRECRSRGLACTHQREVIYQALISCGEHPSPEAIFELVRQQIPSISLATVYKNIRLFIDAGLIAEVSLHHGPARLETNLQPHHHFVCLTCKRIFDLPVEDFEPVRLKRPLPAGFRVRRFTVEGSGYCPDCSPDT